MTAPTLLNVHQAAEYLGLHPETVREMARAGQLRGFRGGSGGKTSPWRFRQAALDEHIALAEAKARRTSAA